MRNSLLQLKIRMAFAGSSRCPWSTGHPGGPSLNPDAFAPKPDFLHRFLLQLQSHTMLTKQRAAATFLLFILLYVCFGGLNFRAPAAQTKMTITHTVLFQFKSDLPAAEVQAVGVPVLWTTPHLNDERLQQSRHARASWH